MNIDISHLSKSYILNGQEILVLNDISFRINNGDLVSLTGSSGVGKSTLLHVIGTLDTPSSGTITFDGLKVHGLSEEKIASFRNEAIGFVFQFHHLLSELSALENVMMPLLMRRQSQKVAMSAAEEVLAFVGLSHRLKHRPGELSGGEQQRVALARALVHKPKLLLADEPTGNLDEKTGEEIIELILSYNRRYGTTVILVTHNLKICQLFPINLRLTKDCLTKMA